MTNKNIGSLGVMVQMLMKSLEIRRESLSDQKNALGRVIEMLRKLLDDLNQASRSPDLGIGHEQIRVLTAEISKAQHRTAQAQEQIKASIQATGDGLSGLQEWLRSSGVAHTAQSAVLNSLPAGADTGYIPIQPSNWTDVELLPLMEDYGADTAVKGHPGDHAIAFDHDGNRYTVTGVKDGKIGVRTVEEQEAKVVGDVLGAGEDVSASATKWHSPRDFKEKFQEVWLVDGKGSPDSPDKQRTIDDVL